jgi:hypothetical protein
MAPTESIYCQQTKPLGLESGLKGKNIFLQNFNKLYDVKPLENADILGYVCHSNGHHRDQRVFASSETGTVELL